MLLSQSIRPSDVAYCAVLFFTMRMVLVLFFTVPPVLVSRLSLLCSAQCEASTDDGVATTCGT